MKLGTMIEAKRSGMNYEKVFDPSVGPLFSSKLRLHTVSPKYQKEIL